MQIEPVSGTDLRAFKERYGFMDTQMMEIFGLSMTSLGAYYRQDVISDPTVAIMLRLYQDHPEMVPLRSEHSIEDLFQELAGEASDEGRRGGRLTLAAFSVLLGRSPTAAFRWARGTSEPNRSISKLMWMLFKLEPGQRLVALKQAALVEAKARGIDLFKEPGYRVKQSWNESSVASFRVRKKKKKGHS